MSDIEVFRFEDFDVRTVIVDGEPWWVLRDVCEVLGLSNPAMVASRVDPDGVSQTEVVDRLGRRQPATRIVNETALYEVTFGSDKPNAVPFRRFAAQKMRELRKTGIATVRPMSPAEALHAMTGQMVEAERRLAQQEAQAAETRRQLTEHAAQINDLKAGTYDWYAGSGYATLNGLPNDVGYLNRLGRIAAAVGREWEVEPGKAPSRMFGKVNTWPMEIWDEALRRSKAEA